MSNLSYSLRLLRVTLRQQWRAERAYLGNFWLESLSKIVYNLMFLLFIDQLFKRIGSVAGYSQNDFLFMYLISQVGFYITYYVILESMTRLVSMINTGSLDLLLLKPVPHKQFIYMSSQRPFNFIASVIPMVMITASQINFGMLNITPWSLLLGTVIISCGIIIANTLLFVLVIPAFKTGEATDSLSVFYSISVLSQMPYDKLPVFMKLLSVTVLPQLVISAATTQIILSKHDFGATVMLVILAAGVSLIVSRLAWRYAMRQYTSASS